MCAVPGNDGPAALHFCVKMQCSTRLYTLPLYIDIEHDDGDRPSDAKGASSTCDFVSFKHILDAPAATTRNGTHGHIDWAVAVNVDGARFASWTWLRSGPSMPPHTLEGQALGED